MAISYFPFDAGAGANVTEDQWRKMARHWLGTGVLADEDDELVVSESASPGMSVDVATGKAWLRGHYMESDAIEAKAITAADPTDDRIDRVVLRVDFTSNTCSIEVIDGTPDAAPVAPALTQSASRWEISLAQVLVEAGATSILDAAITDERELVVSGGGGVDAEIDYVALVAAATATGTTEGTATVVATSNAVDYDGATEVEVELYFPTWSHSAARDTTTLYLFEDGVSLGIIFQERLPNASDQGGALVAIARLTPTAGEHTYTVRGTVQSGTATFTAGAGGVGAVRPGWLKVTTV